MSLQPHVRPPPQLNASETCEPVTAEVGDAPPDYAEVQDFSRLEVDPRTGKRYHPVWAWLAQNTTVFPANALIIFFVTLCTAGVAWPIGFLEVQNAMQMAVPRGTNLFEGIGLLEDTFGVGMTMPYKLMLEPVPSKGDDGPLSVYTPVFWFESQRTLRDMCHALPYTTPADWMFPSWAQNVPVPLDLVTRCTRNSTFARARPEICRSIIYEQQEFVNDDETAMWGLITLQIDPLGKYGPEWLYQMQAMVDDMTRHPNVRMTLTGQGVDSVFIVDQTYRFFPWMVAITCVVALTLLGVAFRSLIIPVRSVLSICLTLAFVYGMSVLTYQWGMLDWMNFPGLSGEYEGTNWFIPVICFSVDVGICLDYDIFLLSRTTEFREQGMSALDANRHALCSTGGIITAAGVIMAIAFSGLMFASILPVNQLSFFLVVAVLYDTFVVRTLFAPAITSLLGRWTWFPSKLSKRP